MKWYKLNEDNTASEITDLDEFNSEFLEDDSRKRVGLDFVKKSKISTVFLFFDHNMGFFKDAKPILFETMIFGGDHDEYQRRYSTYTEALDGHNNILKAMLEDKDPDFYFND